MEIKSSRVKRSLGGRSVTKWKSGRKHRSERERSALTLALLSAERVTGKNPERWREREKGGVTKKKARAKRRARYL